MNEQKVENRLPLSLSIIIIILLIVTLILAAFQFGLIKIETRQPATIDSVVVPEQPTELTGPFLHDEEVFVVEPTAEVEEVQIIPVEKVLFEYVEVIDGCAEHYEGECLNARSGPGLDYPVVNQLRNGIVLKVGGRVERDDRSWYKIIFDEWLRYPGRVGGDWYVAADYVQVLLDEGDKTIWDDDVATNTKKIIVERKTQKLYAYDGDNLFMETAISTGLELTPTPRGEFTIFKKTPSRYMQGPIPNIAEQYYDMPGVPWNLYFTHSGAVIHGAYWHNSFGTAYSHGCVNLPPAEARKIYNWAELGTKVIVRD